MSSTPLALIDEDDEIEEDFREGDQDNKLCVEDDEEEFQSFILKILSFVGLDYVYFHFYVSEFQTHGLAFVG